MNYRKISFFPDKFERFLVKKVGYTLVDVKGTPLNLAKGFKRPILVFEK